MDLLRKSRKIYIGFASTLLYEASKHENYVIILDTSFLDVYLDFEFDMYFEEKEWAEKCQDWCENHYSCNAEITQHAITNPNK